MTGLELPVSTGGVGSVSAADQLTELPAIDAPHTTSFGPVANDLLDAVGARPAYVVLLGADVDIEDAEGKLIATGTATYKMGTKVGKHE